MWNLSIKSVTLATLVSIAWYFGVIELVHTLSNFTTEWYWYVLATVYTVTINELFAHLICTHKFINVDPTRITYKILTFLSTVDHSYAPITDFCLNHPVHHRFSDVMDKDNLNYRTAWYTVCSCSPLMFIYQPPLKLTTRDRSLEVAVKNNKAIFDDNWTNFCEIYKIPLTIIFWAVIYFILPIVLFKVVFMGRVLMSIFNLSAAVLGHSTMLFGYRNFDVPNTTGNNLIAHYVLALGVFSSMLHNNHHSNILNGRHDYRWFEIDLGKYIIRILSIGLCKRKTHGL